MYNKRLAIILSLLLVFTAIFTLPISKEPAHAEGEQLYVNAEILYLREGPGLSYPILETLKDGTAVTSLGKDGDWQKVRVGNQEGFVASWLVESAKKSSAATNQKTVVARVNTLNLRAEPSLSAAVLAKISSGTESTFLQQKGDWIQVQFDGMTGWVFGDYVTIKEATVLQDPSTDANDDSEVKNIQSSENDPNTFTINVSAVNIRKKPDLTAKKLKLATKNEQFTVVSRDHNWVQIEYEEGKKGWIYSFYGTFTKQKTTTKQKETTRSEESVTIIYNGTNLREQPTTSSNVVARVDAGTTYKIIETEGEWYKIALNDDNTAYVADWVVTNDQGTEKPISANKEKRKKGTLKGLTLVVDAGHGGNDRGTTGVRNTDEKDITILTAELLRSKLQAAGANVIMTRESDVYVDLRKRVAVSHQSNADAFISIHYDALEDSSVHGFTTYYTNSYQQELAEYINAGIAEKISLKDRGARFGNYLVLRENRQPSVLLELGYLSNPTEERTITTDYFREQATLGIYQGLLDYFDDQLEK
ncbi:SH3 domain-containing protein [Solibacillus sp. MA9]|uniref:SH3 domain-containing protein n=1 Tax=Solibacillus palustris TaxID=2908203 RepID=A0ABS9UC42_9BACL|nr:SH3 domain-containing protein [Solibacillus sp. MA9]MCH7321705.1 SH3 domain-containing protein [Solibacillus sp. MA9]